jgi:hypothetical protein
VAFLNSASLDVFFHLEIFASVELGPRVNSVSF